MKIKTLSFLLMIWVLVAYSHGSPAGILFSSLPAKQALSAQQSTPFLVSAEEAGQTTPTVKIMESNTATDMLDRELVDQDGVSAAHAHDLILNKKGKIELLVVSEESMIGVTGKLVALDFKAMVKPNPATGFLEFTPVSRALLKQAAPFSLAKPVMGDTKKVIPAGGMSVSQILKGKIIDERGKSLADINNIAFDGLEAEYVVVSVNELLDMGEQRAVLDFADLIFLPDENGKVINARLTASQVSDFKEFLLELKGQG